MQGQLPDGVAVKHFQQTGKFLRCLKAKPCLYGDGKRRILKNRIQEGIQRIHITEHTGALALGSDGAGRTAQVQIHLVIAKIPALLRRP